MTYITGKRVVGSVTFVSVKSLDMIKETAGQMPGVFYNDRNRNLKPKRDIFQDGSVPKHNQSFSASHDELKNVTLIDIKFQKNIHHGY